MSDGRTVIDLPGAILYGDPPYAETYDYASVGRSAPPNDYGTEVLRKALGPAVLSEGRALRHDGWASYRTSLVARTSAGKGAEGQREEWLYVKRAPWVGLF